MTPVKYERDIIQETNALIILKNWENNGTEKIGFVANAHPWTAFLVRILVDEKHTRSYLDWHDQ